MIKNIAFIVMLAINILSAEQDIHHLITQESEPNSLLGICIKNITTGETLCQYNDSSLLMLASLQKIITSAAALHFLGPDFRFVTEVTYTGLIHRDGTLLGDVYIYPTGNPMFCTDDLEAINNQLRALNIHAINGKIKVNIGAFDSLYSNPDWSIRDCGNYFGAGAHACTLNKNEYNITFEPGKKVGDPARIIQIDPHLPFLEIHNEVTTGPAGSGDQVFVYGSDYTHKQWYRGTVPIDKSQQKVRAAIPNPQTFFTHFIQKILPPAHSVSVTQQKKPGALEHTVMHLSSPPLIELLQIMNSHSVNIIAEQIIKTIGTGNTANGIDRVEQFLAENGIVAHIKDGSGLARRNIITPEAYVKLLEFILSQDNLKPLIDTLAQPGEEGTLHIFKPLSCGTLKAKTGILWDATTVGGYIFGKNKNTYAFSILCNHCFGNKIKIRKNMLQFLDQCIGEA